MATPVIENTASRLIAFSKRRAGLFKKAHELAVLCDAEVAVIIISADEKFHEYASSSMDKILTRFRECLQSGECRALQSKPEKPEEMVPEGLNQKADKLTSRKWLDEDFGDMDLHDLYELEEKLNAGLLLIKDRKMKLLMEELEESRTQEQQVLQRNQILLRQVEQLQSMAPPVYYPMPISVHYPTTERESGLLPWTSCAPPPAITDGPDTQDNFQTAADKASLPSTSAVASDYGQLTKSNTLPADNDSHMQINTSKPILHWLPHGILSTSFALPLAITDGPETQDNFQTAADKASLPTTSVVANDYDQLTKSNTLPADNDSHMQMNTSKPILHWLPNGVF